MIKAHVRGNYRKANRYLSKLMDVGTKTNIEGYGEDGVKALSVATPKRTGKTAASWTYDISKSSKGQSIIWSNTNMNGDVCVALLIQYGHGTRNGGYVPAHNYIKPAMEPVFKKISQDITEEIKRL